MEIAHSLEARLAQELNRLLPLKVSRNTTTAIYASQLTLQVTTFLPPFRHWNFFHAGFPALIQIPELHLNRGDTSIKVTDSGWKSSFITPGPLRKQKQELAETQIASTTLIYYIATWDNWANCRAWLIRVSCFLGILERSLRTLEFLFFFQRYDASVDSIFWTINWNGWIFVYRAKFDPPRETRSGKRKENVRKSQI